LDVDHGWMEIHPVASFNAVGSPPTSTPTPTAAPTAAPPPPPAAATVTFLDAPTAARGQVANLQVKTAPNTSCSIVVTYKSGPSGAQGLTPATSDGAGNVGWTWRVGPSTTRGVWPITVTCGGASASTTITVT
jgi:micrococcal nuclease